MEDKKLSQEEIRELVESISRPVFNYAIKRFAKQIKSHDEMHINDLITVFLGSMATCDANLLRWVKTFGMNQTKQNVNMDLLKDFFMREVTQQLELKLH